MTGGARDSDTCRDKTACVQVIVPVGNLSARSSKTSTAIFVAVMNKLLVLALLASVVAYTTAQSAQCQAAAQQCVTTLMNNLPSYTNQNQACAGFKTFIDCVQSACGSLPSQILKQIQDAFNQAGFQCSIPGSAVAASVSLLLVPIMAALPAVIRKLW